MKICYKVTGVYEWLIFYAILNSCVYLSFCVIYENQT